jgi:Alw26I/Eco31I/Esp3I family type II restriction m6 adenine DNA methyltransferase
VQATTLDDFVGQAIARWRDALKSLGGSEIDERNAFTSEVLTKLLGYNHVEGDYQVEERGTYTDIAVYDKQHAKVLVIETKRSDKTIDGKETEDQAFGYADTFTRYVGICNLRKFKLYKIDHTLLVEIDFYTILNRARTVDRLKKGLLTSEYASIDRLRFISKEEIYDETVFDDFDEGYHATDAADSERFADLIQTLEKCVQYLFGYALRAFSEYEGRLRYYDENAMALAQELKSAVAAKDEDLGYRIRVNLDELSRSSQNYLDFRKGFEVWRTTSQRTYDREDEYSEAFCREAAYVLINKILFIRVCEDKLLLPKKISNGGIAIWKAFTEYLKEKYKDLLAVAYSDASNLYDHIYQKGIFDWYQYGNSELNDILRRIFWNLNHFDFAYVNRDILGRIYERYLSPDQRKALGEFYTPPEVVKYILDAVGYSPENDSIRTRKLVDLGCGSGGFLVDALSRMMTACDRARIPKKDSLLVAIQGIYGFDIDHFAIHICEMNLAFRLVDAYKAAKTEDAKFVLPRLSIFQTNSLHLPERVVQSRLYSSETLYMYLQEREKVEKLKSEKYFYAVGNPPYVTKQLTKSERDYYNRMYEKSISNRLNLYRLFIHRASVILEEGGLLGFIVPNTWIADAYATAFRLFLRDNFRIKRVLLLPEKAKAFYKVTQATTILILQKDSEPKENYTFELASEEVEDISQLGSVSFKDRAIEEVAFGPEDAYKFVLSPDDTTYDFIKKMRQGIEYLGDIVEDIQSGEIRQSDAEVKDSLHTSEVEGSYPVIHGDNIDAYAIDLTPSRKDPMWYLPPAKKLTRDSDSTKSRIVLQRIANMALKRRVKTAYLRKGKAPVYVENGANYILPRRSKEYSIEYLVGLLNSTSLNQYFKLFSSNNNVQPSDLKRLPIKTITKANQKTATLISLAVAQITEVTGQLLKSQDMIRDPTCLISNGVSVYKSSIHKFPSGILSGPAQVRREGARLYVTGLDCFDCEDETQAKCVEVLVSKLNDLSEIPNMKVPETKHDCQRFLSSYEEAKQAVETYPEKINSLQGKIDHLVHELYELSSEEIDLVENKTVGFSSPAADEE